MDADTLDDEALGEEEVLAVTSTSEQAKNKADNDFY